MWNRPCRCRSRTSPVWRIARWYRPPARSWPPVFCPLQAASSEWGCLDYQVSASASTVKLRLKNNLGEPVTISNIAVGTDGASSLVCTAPAVPISNIRSGEAKDLTFTACGLAAVGAVQGEKTKINVTIDYYTVKSGNSYTRQTRGDMYVGVV